MRINAYKDPTNPKKVLITPSGVGADDNKNLNVKLQLSGYEPETIAFNVSASSSETITSTPSSINAYVGDDVVLTISGKSGDITVGATPEGISTSIDQSERTITVSSTRAQSGSLQVSVGDVSINVPFVFTALKTIEATLNPANGKVTRDKAFTLTVTSEDDVNATLETSSTATISPSTGKSFTIRSNDNAEGTNKIILTKEGYVRKEIPITFRAKDEISHTISSNSITVGEEIVITVTGLSEGRTLIATSSDPKVTPVVESNLVKLTASQEVSNVTITVKGDSASEEFIEQFTERVTFTAVPKDTISVALVPSTGRSPIGGTIKATVTGTTASDITATPSDSKITVTPEEGNKVFNITAREAVDGTITFSSPSINNKVISVGFAEETQFTVDNDNVEILDSDLPYTINVRNLVGELTCKVSNPLVFDAEVSGSTVIVSKKGNQPLLTNVKCNITLHVEGQNDVIVRMLVKPVPVKGTMPCDGLVIKGYENEEIYFNAPTKDSDDVISATIDSDDVTVEVRDVNRIFVNTGKNAPHGTYIITVKHSEFKDARVVYKSMKKATVIIPPDGGPMTYYDLGEAPDVELETTSDDFIKQVFESDSITTDQGRIAYVLANGDSSLKSLANVLCGYNATVGLKQSTPIDMVGGRWNRLVFDKFLYVFGISDYYIFRNHIRLMIKIMKHYRQNSLSTINMMRFESGWIGTREELSLYRNIAAFLNKYIDANGQNVKVSGLEITGDGYKNMERYCSENIQP